MRKKNPQRLLRRGQVSGRSPAAAMPPQERLNQHKSIVADPGRKVSADELEKFNNPHCSAKSRIHVQADCRGAGLARHIWCQSCDFYYLQQEPQAPYVLITVSGGVADIAQCKGKVDVDIFRLGRHEREDRERLFRNPERWRTGEPEEIRRAALYQIRGLSAFAEATGLTKGDGIDTMIYDLLADIAHLCDRQHLCLAELLAMAQTHYSDETEGQGRQKFESGL